MKKFGIVISLVVAATAVASFVAYKICKKKIHESLADITEDDWDFCECGRCLNERDE